MFQIEDSKIKLINNNHLLELTEQNQPNYNLLHFNCSKNSIWVSMYALDRHNFYDNYIKFGQGYVMENNLLAEFRAKSQEAFDSLRKISNLFFDQDVDLFEQVCLSENFVKTRQGVNRCNQLFSR